LQEKYDHNEHDMKRSMVNLKEELDHKSGCMASLKEELEHKAGS
jgi:hypothetical protein